MFRFSLEQVLGYREQLEHQARVELARVESERIREQERADTFQRMLTEQEHDLFALGPDKKAERWLAENFIKGLRSDLKIALQRVHNWTIAAEAARAELLRRSKDKKVLEKLKATQAENYAKEELQREQREFDETASLRFKAAY